MVKKYVLKSNHDGVIYQGDNRLKCLELMDSSQDTNYEIYEYEVIGDRTFSLRKSIWSYEEDKREFKRDIEGIKVTINGEGIVSGLLDLLQSELERIMDSSLKLRLSKRLK